MDISIEVLKQVIYKVENTIFPEDQTKLTIPILAVDFLDMKYDKETVKTYNIYFEKIDGVWHIQI